MQGLLARLLVMAIGGAILACAPAQDGGADLLRSFFRDLEAHRFDAAADLVREADGAPLSATTRDRFVRGWRKAYEGYAIRFTNVVVRRYPESPRNRCPKTRFVGRSCPGPRLRREVRRQQQLPLRSGQLGCAPGNHATHRPQTSRRNMVPARRRNRRFCRYVPGRVSATAFQAAPISAARSPIVLATSSRSRFPNPSDESISTAERSR